MHHLTPADSTRDFRRGSLKILNPTSGCLKKKGEEGGDCIFSLSLLPLPGAFVSLRPHRQSKQFFFGWWWWWEERREITAGAKGREREREKVGEVGCPNIGAHIKKEQKKRKKPPLMIRHFPFSRHHPDGFSALILWLLPPSCRYHLFVLCVCVCVSS